MIGQSIGPYEVLSKLGAGGMGEVYRARDTRLDRDVAIKILPAAVASDPDRLMRFEREARTLAALNHPHIAHVYGLEDVPRTAGEPAAGALVMELVDGEDLEERLRRGALPVDEAIAIARQIADALETAHELGIVHRDLKPANVKVRSDGAVKVLDFGLAKALDDPRANDGNAATLTSPALTAHGIILGTAAYISPEQARGRPIDKRADIWSFGVVLFEMLTGTRLFAGETMSDTLASVLRQDIPWNTLPPATPLWLRRLLQRCLERDSKRRLRDIGEARVALETGDVADAAAGARAGGRTPAAPASYGRLASVAAPLLLLLAVAAFTFWPRAEPQSSPQVIRAVLPHADAGVVNGWLRITPDGREVIFTATRDGVRRIYVRSLDRMELRALAGTEGADGVFLSPDARSIGFFVGRRLKRMPLAGGAIEDLAEVPPTLIRAAAWTSRGEIITAVPGSLVRIPERGGSPTPLAEGGLRGSWPIATADGRHIVFMQGGSGGVEDDYLTVVSLDTGALQKTTIVTREPVGMYAGHVLFRREDGALTAVRFDEQAGQIVGEPFQVLESSATAAVSASGTAVYLADDGREELAIWEGSRRQAVWQPPWTPREPRLSPAAPVIALTREETISEVWTYDLATGTPTKIADRAVRATWSRDGRTLVYLRERAGLQPMREVYSRPSDASGPEVKLFETPELRLTDAHLMADGGLLISADSPDGNSLLRVPPSGDRTPVAVIEPERGFAHPRVSRDGAWLAYTSAVSGTAEVYARPLSAQGTRLTISVGGGVMPVWHPSGGAIVYRQGDRFVRATLELTPSPRVVNRETILTGEFSRRGRWSFDLLPDGRLLAFEPQPGSTRMVLVHNWFAEVRDRLSSSR